MTNDYNKSPQTAPVDPGWNEIPEPSPLDALLLFLNVAPEIFPT